MFSSDHDAGQRVEALRAGAEDFLTRPIDDQTLLARLRSLLRAREVVGGFASPEGDLSIFGLADSAASFDSPGKVALVMHRPESAIQLRKQLSAAGQDHFAILAPEGIYSETASASPADVYLIDADIGSEGGGLRVMSELLSRSASRNAAFCIFNQANSTVRPAIAFDLGANDVVDSRTGSAELAVRLHTLVIRKRELDQMRASVQDGLRLAMIDPLTGLHNRRYGLAQLNAIAAKSQEESSEFAVMVVDLDRFKSVNDRWGHAAGDAVLVEISSRIAANLRASDLVARIGGEEFLIALPNTTRTEAGIVAQRLCEAAEAQPVILADGSAIHVTISIGMTIDGGPADPAPSLNVADIVDQADRALMKSKAGGRNKVTILSRAA